MPVTITIPEGFKQFLDIFPEIQSRPIPSDMENIISNGQREACLGHNMTSAEQVCMFDLLECSGILEKVGLGYTAFSDLVEKYLIKQKASETDNKRICAINRLLADKENVIQGLLGVPEFVKREGVTTDTIKKLKKDEKAAWKLFDDICNSDKKVIGFGSVKTTLWLHSMSIGEMLPTPSSHVKWFLRKYFPYSTSSYRFDDVIPDQETMAYAKKYVEMMNNQLKLSCSAGKFTNAIWVWKNCINAMLRYGNRLTPDTLAKFMKFKKLSLDDIEDSIIDLHEFDALGEDLTDFVS